MIDKLERSEVILTIQCNKENSYMEFVDRAREAGLVSRYQLAQVPLPELSFRNYFLEHIYKHGFSSMLTSTLVMEDITSPSMTSNQVEAVMTRFVQTLLPATRLVIIDPYFYAPNPSNDTDAYIARLLGPQAVALQELFVFTVGGGAMKAPIHSALTALAPSLQVHQTNTQAFHDRFWINPDAGTGIAIGTSLNGIGRKIALVDKLSLVDVQDVLTEVRRLNSNV